MGPTAGPRRYFAAIVLALLLLDAASTCLHKAPRRPFWYDEIFTLTTAGQGSAAAIWNALAHGLDSNPPLFYLIEAWAGRLSTNPHVACRIPSLIAFLLASLALFCFALPRLGRAWALLAAGALLLTPLYTHYALEARPYAMVSACIAWALVAWQRSGRKRMALLLAFLFMLSTSLHYLAELALAPFALAEAVRTLRVRQLRPAVWAAFGAALLPLVAFWPLISNFRHVYGGHFWAQPGLASLPLMYNDLLGLPGALILVLPLAAGLLPRLLQHKPDAPGSPARPAFLPEECAVIFGLICLPLLGVILSILTHAAMSERYVLAALLGVSLAAAHLVSQLHRRAALVLAVALLAAIGVQEASYWSFRRHEPLAASANIAAVLDDMLRESGARGLPVAVSSGLEYLPIAYYSPSSASRRVVAIIDPPKAVAYQKTDSLDQSLTILAGYRPIDIQNFDRFAPAYPRFLLLSSGGMFDWWPARLRDDSYSLQPLVKRQGDTLYLVQRQN